MNNRHNLSNRLEQQWEELASIRDDDTLTSTEIDHLEIITGELRELIASLALDKNEARS